VSAVIDFFDTNVICYLFGSDDQKAARAETLLQKGGMVSTQVLAETTNVARKKGKLTWSEVDGVIDLVSHLCEVKPITFEIFQAAKAIASQHNIHIYDAQIIAAALHYGATNVWSEDMQTGRLFDRRLTIKNPFS
jgi:predicted nucleic acid-binding protein